MPQMCPTISRVLTLAMLLSTALADTVVLKTGERIQGRILSETDQELKLEVKVSAGITDDRVIAKTDIEKIEKVSPEMEAYRAIATIQPGANSFAPAQYDPLIRVLQAFLTQYPDSSNTAAVQTALEGLEAEKKRVESGEAKLNGQWLTKAEVEREKVQINGRLAFNYMRQQAVAGDFIGALNTFAALEKPYAGAATFPDAVDLARQILAKFKPAADAAIPNQLALKAEREKGFAAAGPLDRKDMMDAYKKEQDAASDAVAAAEKANVWPPFIAGSEKSVKALQARITKESDRLAKMPVDKMRRSLQLVDEATQKVGTADLDDALAALKEATIQWPANELAVRLTREVTAQKVEASKAKATPAPATPTPKPTPSKPASKPSAALSAAAAKHDEEESTPFYMTLPGAISIVVGLAVVLIGVNVFQKMKARKAAAAE